MSPFLSEFLGTAILITLGNGTVANVVLQKTKGHNSGWIVITVAARAPLRPPTTTATPQTATAVASGSRRTPALVRS